MDLHQSIDLNKTAIARILAGLFAMLGLSDGPAPGRISKALFRSIQRVLYPAESAVRRLIVLMAMTIRVKAKTSPQNSRPVPANIVRRGQGKARPSFRLFDPPHQFLPQTQFSEAASGPRIFDFGNGENRTLPGGRARQVDDGLEDSAGLVRRLEAIKAALDDLPRQARRLTRALARRQASPRPMSQKSLRPGHPPGWRRRPRQEIDHVLRECDWLAREALPPDTS